jgi:uncharacterized repeat protein (TIGR02543 family)
LVLIGQKPVPRIKAPARISGGVWIPAAVLALLILSCPLEVEDREGTFYTVGFETNGGTPVPPHSVAANTKLRISSLSSNPGYILTGWYIDGGLGVSYKFEDPVTGNITLYAKWEAGTPLDTRSFWAQRLDNDQYYEATADLLALGDHCKIWVERDPKGSAGPAAAQAMAAEYESIIYPRMIGAFNNGGTIYDNSGATPIGNIMDYADWMGDGDTKLSILLLDIQDTYNPPERESYVGGYFWAGNFYRSQYSNMTDMIYVDTYPGKPGTTESNKTLAHEMQHLMNYAASLHTRKGALMETWIDEGLSSAAEYIYLDYHVSERYDWFNKDRKGTIARGNNFFVWGNYQDDSILDDYATVYLFFQWLRIQAAQAGNTGIYKDIIWSKYSNYLAVTGAADKAMSGNNYYDWGTLLKTWMAANYLNAPTGPYGYLSDPTLKIVRAKTAPSGTTSLPLLPGEGAYSIVRGGVSVSGSGANIKYAGLYKNGSVGVVDDTPASGGALLTYNANTDLKGQRETGRLTGLAADLSTARSGGGAEARSAVSPAAWEGPVRIDARDMLARNGFSGEARGE